MGATIINESTTTTTRMKVSFYSMYHHRVAIKPNQQWKCLITHKQSKQNRRHKFSKESKGAKIKNRYNQVPHVPGYQWESDKLTVRHHIREPRGQPKSNTWKIINIRQNLPYTASIIDALTPCLQGNFACRLVVCCIFTKSTFSKFFRWKKTSGLFDCGLCLWYFLIMLTYYFCCGSKLLAYVISRRY